ncbi:MAG: DUF1624 domain-containing protein, partial [Chloroflexi bacterium]|nr:DUF1624 domain-containing protein [Chloroflexota bacterium]
MQQPSLLPHKSLDSPAEALPARLTALDSLRGLAIASMVLLNLSAVVLAGVPPLPLRLIGSLAAAPVFILLSGLMVALTADRHGLLYFLLGRGLWILAVGAFVDLVVWRIYPFMGVEVLYIIGVSIPLAYLALKLAFWPRLGLMVALVALAPLLRGLLGYSHFPLEFYLWGEQVWQLADPPKLGPVQHWLVDGWFPLFPWLSFAVLGAHLGERLQQRGRPAFLLETALLGVALTVAGAAAYVIAPPNSFVRGVWSELFYPPTVQFTVLALGVAVLLLALSLRWGGFQVTQAALRPLAALGRASLGLYFLHLALAVFVGLRVTGGWSQLSLGQYGLAYLAMMLALLAAAEAYAQVKRRWRPLTFWGLRGLVGAALTAAVILLVLGQVLGDTGFA